MHSKKKTLYILAIVALIAILLVKIKQSETASNDTNLQNHLSLSDDELIDFIKNREIILTPQYLESETCVQNKTIARRIVDNNFDDSLSILFNKKIGVIWKHHLIEALSNQNPDKTWRFLITHYNELHPINRDSLFVSTFIISCVQNEIEEKYLRLLDSVDLQRLNQFKIEVATGYLNSSINDKHKLNGFIDWALKDKFIETYKLQEIYNLSSSALDFSILSIALARLAETDLTLAIERHNQLKSHVNFNSAISIYTGWVNHHHDHDTHDKALAWLKKEIGENHEYFIQSH